MLADPAPTPPLRVVVVDADDRVRESLSRLLCIGDKLCVVGTAGAPESGLEVVRATEPDIVVVDPRLPEVEGGLAFIQEVREIAPAAKVLVMSATDTPELTELKASADRVVRKTFRATDLLSAILG
jgi:DNA-binding NarL/FixJ family response regulator